MKNEVFVFCFFFGFLSFSVSSYTQQFNLKVDFKKEEAKKTGRSWTSTSREFCWDPPMLLNTFCILFFFPWCLLPKWNYTLIEDPRLWRVQINFFSNTVKRPCQFIDNSLIILLCLKNIRKMSSFLTANEHYKNIIFNSQFIDFFLKNK